MYTYPSIHRLLAVLSRLAKPLFEAGARGRCYVTDCRSEPRRCSPIGLIDRAGRAACVVGRGAGKNIGFGDMGVGSDVARFAGGGRKHGMNDSVDVQCKVVQLTATFTKTAPPHIHENSRGWVSKYGKWVGIRRGEIGGVGRRLYAGSRCIVRGSKSHVCAVKIVG